jgi:hypothetical protein
MCFFTSNATTHRRLLGGLLVAFLCVGAALHPALTTAQGNAPEKIPNFAPTSKVGWLSAGTGWISPPSGPGPVLNHRDYRYVPNNTGEQPTFRVADVDNPILQPWTVEAPRRSMTAYCPVRTRSHRRCGAGR